MGDKKLLAGITGILVGSFGIHKFVLGYNKEGVIYLIANLVIVPIISVVTCGTGSILYVINVIPIIEGILYLVKSDEEYKATYIDNKRPWF